MTTSTPESDHATNTVRTSELFRHKESGTLYESTNAQKDGGVAKFQREGGKSVHIVEFHRQGGGFVQKLPFDDFHAQFEPAEAPTLMRKGKVSADFLPDDVEVPCWSDGLAWNGWGTPYFERAVVDELIKHGVGPMKWDGDKVVAQMGDDPEDIEVYEMEKAPDGTPIWGVGAYSWCWNSVEFPEPAPAEVARVSNTSSAAEVAVDIAINALPVKFDPAEIEARAIQAAQTIPSADYDQISDELRRAAPKRRP